MTERNEDIDMTELEEIKNMLPAATTYMDELLATKGPEYLSTVINLVLIREKLNEICIKDPDKAELLIIDVSVQVFALLKEAGIPVEELTKVSDKLYELGIGDLQKAYEAPATGSEE